MKEELIENKGTCTLRPKFLESSQNSWDFLGFFGIGLGSLGVNPKPSQNIPIFFLDEINHPKKSGMFWDGSQTIPNHPNFFGIIWGDFQKNWDHSKKIGVILRWFGGDTRGFETVT